jgi:histidine triad (HIT) family protein
VAFELPERDPCPFCENVSSGITSNGVECVKVLEDDKALAFVAPRPIQPGSLIVISKRHATTMLDVADDELGAVMRMVQRLRPCLLMYSILWG